MSKENYKKFFLWFTFAVCLLLYVFTSCPTVPPYRDSGELITAASTLSIAHSPGYPLYMVLGKFFVSLGGILGMNPARVMNMFSSLAGAFAVFFLFLVIYELCSNIFASLFGALLAGFSYSNWYLAVVAEMYSLNLMLIALLLYLTMKRKYMLFCFMAGLNFGNHLTSLFAVLPMAGYLVCTGEIKKMDLRKGLLFFLLGLSVYLYLPVRAAGEPFINWGDPSSLQSFWRVISRASYGHTLDLVSREVTLSQVLLPQFGIFIKSLNRDLTPLGILMCIAGIVWGIKKKRDYSLMIFSVFFLTGPLFLYMAKMPVNPHATAIVEVNYMMPVMVLSLFAALGLAVFLNRKKMIYPTVFIGGAILFYSAVSTYPRVNKSKNYFAEDYALNILRTADSNGAIIMRRDHTMFSLWYMKDIRGVRPDLKVISKGLISARWYRDKLRLDHPEISWKEEYLSDTEYIEWFLKEYSGEFPVYITASAAGELDKDFYQKHELQFCGLVFKVAPKGEDKYLDAGLSRVEQNYIYRGDYRTSRHYDFFSRDFISLYAGFYSKIGMQYQKNNNFLKARAAFLKALDFDPFYPDAYSGLGYSYYVQGDMEEARSAYIKAIDLIKKKIKQYTRNQIFKKDISELYNNLGAVYEKNLRSTQDEQYFEKALSCYNRAVELNPSYAQVYYNIGVLYWQKNDWRRVVDNFRTALEYDPDNMQIKKYLVRAAQNLPKNR